MSPKRRLKVALGILAGSTYRWRGALGIAYHRIGDGGGSPFDRAIWSTTAERLDEHLHWLKAHFEVISPAEVQDAVRTRRGRNVVITFDDGYIDNYAVAYPMLRRHGLAATFFVATGFIDEPRLPWWDEVAWMIRSSPRAGVALPAFLPADLAFDEPDREQAVETLLRLYKRLPAARTVEFLEALGGATESGRYGARVGNLWMTWDMLREMHAGGMTIGGHTVHHQVLAQMPRDQQAWEIAECGRRIQEELGVPMRTFAYPTGKKDSFNEDTRSCLRDAGVETAFSYHGGFRRRETWDDLDIRRIGVELDTTFDEFRADVLAPWLSRA
jgi:peptidoglycan/xylan/chitin deacetylase (PgdA/CDA1 family)